MSTDLLDKPTLDMIKGFSVGQRVLKVGRKNYLLPKLHNMFFAQDNPDGNEGFAAVCLEFAIWSWGETVEESQEILDRLVDMYFKERLKNNEIKEIYDDIALDDMSHYWGLYRQYSISQAAAGEPSEMATLINSLSSISEKLQKKKRDNSKLLESLGLLEDGLKSHKGKTEALEAENSYLKKQLQTSKSSSWSDIEGIPSLSSQFQKNTA